MRCGGRTRYPQTRCPGHEHFGSNPTSSPPSMIKLSSKTEAISERNDAINVYVESFVTSRTSEHDVSESSGIPAENDPCPGISISGTTRTARDRAYATISLRSSCKGDKWAHVEAVKMVCVCTSPYTCTCVHA